MTDAPAIVSPRKTDDAPFCWQSKSAIWRIREAFDESTFLDQAFAVYLTLSELASDEQSPTFKATRRKIAERSGVSMRRVSEILARFKLLSLLDWKQNFQEGTKELAPSTYTLSRCTAGTRLGTPRTRLGTDKFSGNCTVVEQSPNNLSEESTKGNSPLEKFRDWQLRKDLRESSNPAEIAAIKAELKRRRLVATPHTAKQKPALPKAAAPEKLQSKEELEVGIEYLRREKPTSPLLANNEKLIKELDQQPPTATPSP